MTTQEINKTIEEYEYYKSITTGKRQVQYFDEVIDSLQNQTKIEDFVSEKWRELWMRKL